MKNLRTAKAALMMGIMLISVIAVFMPTGSAALLKLQGNLTASIGEPDRIVTPYGQQLQIPIKVGYAISGVGADVVYFANNPVRITIEVTEMPEWASISVPIPQILLTISTEFQYDNTTIGIDVNENAPAMATDNIKVLIKAEKIRGIGGEVGEVTYGPIRIDFKPTYTPILSMNVRDGNYQEIGPMENAFFHVDLENLGNGKTEVVFEVLGLPKDWTVSVPNIITLGSKAFGDDPTGSVTLTVQPPRGFGYHDDKETIQLKVKVRYFLSASTTEKEYPLDVTVYSRGISTIGIEVALIVIILIALVIAVILLVFTKKFKRK